MKRRTFSLFITYLSILLINVCSSEDLLEMTCFDDAQCSQFNEHGTGIVANCLNGSCECKRVATETRIECKPQDIKHSNVIGGACPCSLPNAECNTEQDICYCAKGYLPSTDRRRCIKESVELFAPCEMDDQCTASKLGNNLAICSKTRNRCQCIDGFAEHNNECHAIVGKPNCRNDTQCHEFEHLANCRTTTTIASFCLCPLEFVSTENKTKCIGISNYGEHCIAHQQCQRKLGPGGVCTNGICRCDEKYFDTLINGTDGSMQTICQREVGSYCRRDEQCIQLHLKESEQSMTCCKGECNCKYGYNNFNNINCTRDNGTSTILPDSLLIFLFFLARISLRYLFK